MLHPNAHLKGLNWHTGVGAEKITHRDYGGMENFDFREPMQRVLHHMIQLKEGSLDFYCFTDSLY